VLCKIPSTGLSGWSVKLINYFHLLSRLSIRNSKHLRTHKNLIGCAGAALLPSGKLLGDVDIKKSATFVAIFCFEI
jgi:hypothetical protein